ncbi:DUF134 domain-containing protein [Candidatus Pacearchaeota archaeon]|nr:DUF134 domain-containing protein [Candidatus Pacearchaeota archaeon]MBD3282746.1 DUF134 domain-containing protein [Candidatus Pacearchaeota archaeon]
MPRPRRIRRIFFQPDVTYFKPAGIPISHLNQITLSFDELEAIRLIDSEEMEQTKAAKKMKISQSTLSRLIKNGRKKLSDALTKGYSIKIQGGNFKMTMPRKGLGLGQGAGRGRGRGLGRGRMRGFSAGPDGNCICPKCGYRESHKKGVPCYQKKCPKCNNLMTRE